MNPADEILIAAKEGDARRVLELLDEDAALVNISSLMGAEPIHAAHFGGHERVVNILLARGVQMDVYLAVELGKLALVKATLDAEPGILQGFNASGSTLLHSACYWGQVDVTSFLLERGADPDVATEDNFLKIRPLGCAVATPDVPNPSDEEGVVLELVRLLLAAGANVNGRRLDGLTALHSAAYRGHLRVLEFLLARGADTSIAGSTGPHMGQTARDVAVAQGQLGAVAMLGGKSHHSGS